MEFLDQHIESLIFASENAISIKTIEECLTDAFGVKQHKKEILNSIDRLKEKYADDNFSFEIVEISGGYQFLSKGAYHNTVGALLKQLTKRKLSRAALETLAIIAYKQPVTKPETERIRGVSCDYSIQKLLEKELVSIIGRSDAPGKPLLYGTSDKFMDYFGLSGINDLPKPKDFKDPNNEIGEQSSETAEKTNTEEQTPEE